MSSIQNGIYLSFRMKCGKYTAIIKRCQKSFIHHEVSLLHGAGICIEYYHTLFYQLASPGFVPRYLSLEDDAVYPSSTDHIQTTSLSLKISILKF